MFTCTICGGSGSAESMGPNLLASDTLNFPPSGNGAKWYHITCWAMSPGTGQDEHGLSSNRGYKPLAVTGQAVSSLYGTRSRVQQALGGRAPLQLRNMSGCGATRAGRSCPGRKRISL